MNQQHQGQSSLPSYVPMKRKRGRPRKDENIVQSENMSVANAFDGMKNIQQTAATNIELDNVMVGQVVSGVIEAAFDAGYLLNVRVGNSETQLRGVVFLPGRVAQVTSENDVAPEVRMVKRKELPLPVLAPQTQSLNSIPSLCQKIKQPVGNFQAPCPQDQVQQSEHHSEVPFPLNNRSLSIVGTDPSLPKDNSIVTSGMLQEAPITGKDSQSASLTSQIGFHKGKTKDEVCDTSAESKGVKFDLGVIRDSQPISASVDKLPGTGYLTKDISCEHRAVSPVSSEFRHSSEVVEQTPVSAEFRKMFSDQIYKSMDNTTENQISLETSIPKDNITNFTIGNSFGLGNTTLNERPAAAAATANVIGSEVTPTLDFCQPMTLFPSVSVPSELKSASDIAGSPGTNERASVAQDNTAKLLSDTSKGLCMDQFDRKLTAGTAHSFQMELGPAIELSQPLLSLVGNVAPLESKSIADGTIPGNVDSENANIPGDNSCSKSSMQEVIIPNNS